MIIKLGETIEFFNHQPPVRLKLIGVELLADPTITACTLRFERTQGKQVTNLAVDVSRILYLFQANAWRKVEDEPTQSNL